MNDDRAPTARPMLTIRDWSSLRDDMDAHSAAVYSLPYVRHVEPEPENGPGIDWWSVPRGAFDYWHQAEEVGRTFFEETGRQYLQHGEPIEHALCCALKKMAHQDANWGVGSGFLITLAHYAMIGYAAASERSLVDKPLTATR